MIADAAFGKRAFYSEQSDREFGDGSTSKPRLLVTDLPPVWHPRASCPSHRERRPNEGLSAPLGIHYSSLVTLFPVVAEMTQEILHRGITLLRRIYLETKRFLVTRVNLSRSCSNLH
jgi:hypothetical protein